MSWFVLSLGAALTQAGQFAVVKGRARSIPPLVVTAWTQVVGLTGWATYFILSGDVLRPPWPAWLAIVSSAGVVTAMNLLLIRASARGDISLVAPIFALSPIFTVVPDAVLSGALPTALGWVGIGLCVTGTISLSGPGRESLRALVARPETLDALGAAVLIGVLAAVDRWGALTLGPRSYLMYSYSMATLVAGSIALITSPGGAVASTRPGNLLTVLGHGLLAATGTGLQTTALTMAPAAYVNSIRRLSAVVAVLLGGTLFREPDLGRRLIAALLACAGAACLIAR